MTYEECELFFEQEKEKAIQSCLNLMLENEELKKEISVLLSCKNCSENKGGYICEKEYNDKCLAQKIEYIKELKIQIEKMKNCQNCKNRYPETKEDYIFCAECSKLDETKDNIILTKWECVE